MVVLLKVFQSAGIWFTFGKTLQGGRLDILILLVGCDCQIGFKRSTFTFGRTFRDRVCRGFRGRLFVLVISIVNSVIGDVSCTLGRRRRSGSTPKKRTVKEVIPSKS